MPHRLALAVASVGTALSLGACAGKDTLGCTSNDACPAGHVCLAGKCQELCSTDATCARGTHCDGQICIPGDRGGAPRVDAIAGTSAEACVDDRGQTLGACLGAGLVVTGSNLAGAVWTLSGREGQGDVTLAAATGQTDTKVTLVSAQSVASGLYALNAVTSAGQASTPVQLLRGETGPRGDPGVAGPAGPTGAQGPRGDAGPAGATAKVYLYADASTPTAVDTTHDRMVVTLGAPAGVAAAPRSMQLDDARLTSLCGDADGCKLTLGATQYHYSSAVPVSGPVPVTGGSCRFFLDPPSGRWAVEEGCSIYYATKQYGSSGWALSPGYYARYYSSVTGTSGADNPGRVVVNFELLCVVSDALPSSPANTDGSGAFQAANGHFYLTTSTPAWGTLLWNQTGAWDAATADRACVLIVED